MAIRLDELILPPPMPMVVGILIVVGLAHLGWRLGSFRRAGNANALETAIGFIAVTAVVAAVAYSLAVVHLAETWVLRPIGWSMAAVGVYEIAVFGRKRFAIFGAVLRETWNAVGALERTGLVISGTTIIALAAAALGPPTDADSLAYHLAVPIDWLEHGGAHAQVGWLTMRLVGLGEALNMLGLAAGTDILGACLQIAGLVVAVIAIASGAGSAPARVLAILLVASAPVLLFLVPNQKPQLLPASAIFAALVSFVARREALDRRTIWMAWTAIAFAVGCKYNFLLTGTVVGMVGMIISWSQRKLRASVVAAGCAALLLIGPVWGRNAAVYGDPITPNLEAFKDVPDPAVVRFAKDLREQGVDQVGGGPLASAQEVIGTVRPEFASKVLGVGALAFLLVLPASGSAMWLLISAATATLLVVLFGQISGRFLLEPYLWAGAAAAATIQGESRLRMKLAAGLLSGQTGLVLAFAFVGVVRLFPGGWSWQWREKVMIENATSYAESKWLGEVLPADAVVLALSMRSPVLVPRRTVVHACSV